MNIMDPTDINIPATISLLSNFSFKIIIDKIVFIIIDIELELDSNMGFPKPSATTFKIDPIISDNNPRGHVNVLSFESF